MQFSSDSEFQIGAAYKAVRNIQATGKDDNYEKFTNEDYENLEKLDYRSIRYKKKDRYGENDEVISDLEGQHEPDGPLEDN